MSPRLHRLLSSHRRVRAWVRLAGLGLGLATAAAAAPTDADQVIVPGATAEKPAVPKSGSPGAGAFTLAAVVGLAGAGGWLLWRGRGQARSGFGRASKQLQVEETRSLGARQYLVVARYGEQKFLLGVCPGRIDLLSTLPPAGPALPDRLAHP